MQNAIWKVTALAGLVGIGFLVVLQAQRGLPLPAGPAAGTQPAATGGDGSGRADSTSAADVTAGGDDAPLFDQSEPEPASETRDLTGGDEQPSEDNPFFAANSAASSRAEALSDDSDGMTVIRSVRNSTSGGIDFRQPPPQDEPQFEPQDEPARLDVSEARPVPVPQRDADTESFAADATAVEPIPTEAERGEVRLTRNEAPPFGSTEADPMGEPGFGTEPAFGNESPARDEPTFGSDPEIVPVPAGVHEDEPPSFDPATDEPDAGSDPGPRLLLIGPQDAADRSNAGAGEPSAEADGERAFEPEAMPADADEEQSEDPRTVPFSSSAEETTPGDAEATPGGSRPEPIPDPFGAGGGTVPRTQPNDENRMASPPTVGDDPFGSSPSAFEETAEPKTSPSPQPVEIDAPSIHGRADERHPAAQPTGPADSADDAAHDAGSPSEVPGELPTAGRVVPLDRDELRGDGTVVD
ncbi:MAG: hypothetical protein KY476_03135 [Planctomycetes bacterium]|nr:hypothetical protein [Planctomycetota bacterium]